MIRAVRPDDVDAVVAMVHELAAYERAPHLCHLTPAQLHDALFGESPALFGHVAMEDTVAEDTVAEDTVAEDTAGDGTRDPVGFALWFLNYSTWDGRHGVYLEDLYVRPTHRGQGHGRALLATLAGICAERGYTRLSWWVLDWNAPSIAFYRALGAEAMDGWTTFRLSGQALSALAASVPPAR